MSDKLQQVIDLLLALSQTPSTPTCVPDASPVQAKAAPPTCFAIVIATNGFIFIGNTTVSDDRVVVSPIPGHRTGALRLWGTTKGLGELVAGGPTSKTVIDEIDSDVILTLPHVLAVIPCDSTKFRK